MNIIRNLLKPLSFIPAILMMYLIFSFSSQDGLTSSELSYKVSYKIVEVGGELLGADLEPWEIDSLANRFHGPVRKIAHMTEYFALAVSVSFPLYVYGLRGILLMLVAGIFCVGFACADEYHQAFVDGRGPSKKDVLIDSFGVFWGIILVRIVGWTGRKTIFRPFCKKKKKEAQEQQVPYPQPPYSQPPYSQVPPSVYPPGSAPYQPDTYNHGPGSRQEEAPQGYGQPFYPSDTPYGYRQQPQGGSPYGYGQPSQGHSPYRYGQQPPSQGYYGGQPGASYVAPQSRSFSNGPSAADSNSDHLSEDMSFKKLMHDLKDQKREQKNQSRKPKLDDNDLPSEDSSAEL